MIKTQQAAKLCGISRRTLQYYDEIGLIEVQRDKNGYRLYDQKQLERVWEILIYKEVGFKLDEIETLLLYPDKKENLLLKKLKDLDRCIDNNKANKTLIKKLLNDDFPKVDLKSNKNCIGQLIDLKTNLKSEK